MIENKVLKILNCRQTQANTDNTQSRINGVGNDESTRKRSKRKIIFSEEKARHGDGCNVVLGAIHK